MREPEFDVVVVGAGFAGMYALHRLRGAGFRVRVVEAGEDVGGTWYWNRYPGARCDITSVSYSYSFDPDLQREWRWSERFATQAEILAYAQHVADRFDLRRDITFGTRVTGATREGEDWLVHTDTGPELRARHLVAAVGSLSARSVPDLPGLDTFTGLLLHTGAWPAEPVDVTGLRVGVIGTGSSGIQVIPVLAETAAHLTVFQRTANYSVPAQHRRFTDQEWQRIQAGYPELREQSLASFAGVPLESQPSALAATPAERAELYEQRWREGGLGFFFTYQDLILDPAANATAAEFIRAKIAELVHDPDTAAALTPDSHPVGAKRPCVDDGYFQTFNRPNVSLVDLRKHPLEQILPSGVQAGGQDHDLDVLVLATGYDALTGPLLRLDIRGEHGVRLADRWAEGPTSYLGLTIAGFPNFYVLAGPGSPSVLANVILAAEQHVDWLTTLLTHLREQGLHRAEADPTAEQEWTRQVAEAAAATLYPQADSWYLGANVPGKPRVFMPYAGGFQNYRALCEQVAAEGYRGLRLS
ncbi:NAD(P)/FAD-dependent oxidoreductase [Crossiella sp. CA-258035]|uniref:flavin-containing monooxygenase n=1 Tax=Crossiella sp. CA-258035 TaxID=2981138 RepID=UPI0024BD3CBF|nr:NAD(P)/FAD-dependent oxidoreductase [Crossiella sp. CA-258035]WHT16800.1 NAD(P)/FAD-dependent oxidoreductase [Crossiella sp. CA-258035]